MPTQNWSFILFKTKICEHVIWNHIYSPKRANKFFVSSLCYMRQNVTQDVTISCFHNTVRLYLKSCKFTLIPCPQAWMQKVHFKTHQIDPKVIKNYQNILDYSTTLNFAWSYWLKSITWRAKLELRLQDEANCFPPFLLSLSFFLSFFLSLSLSLSLSTSFPESSPRSKWRSEKPLTKAAKVAPKSR